MSDPAPRLTPRSAGASADVALLRAARTGLGDPETAATTTLAERLRALAPRRAMRQSTADAIVARVDRRGA